MDKAPDAFRTISEVADDLDVPQHVLRFWETRFPHIKPLKRGGGRRYYRPEDVALLRGIRHLLYGEGYTIRGVQRLLKDQGVKFVQGVWREDSPESGSSAAMAGATVPAASEDVDFAADDRPGADEDAAEAGAVERPGPAPAIRPQAAGMDATGSAPVEPAPPTGAHAARAPAGISSEDLGKLQAALRELVECRRLLDAALKDDG